MNNKILVMVYIPLIEEEYDIYIPVNKRVGTVKNLIIKMVQDINEAFIDDGGKYLYDKVSGNKIDNQQFVRHSTIKNGSKLILY